MPLTFEKLRETQLSRSSRWHRAAYLIGPYPIGALPQPVNLVKP